MPLRYAPPMRSTAPLLALLLLTLTAATAQVSTPEPPPPPPVPDVSLTTYPLLPAGASADTVQVIWNGAVRQVASVSAVEPPWRIVLYFDTPLTDPEALEEAAWALADRAEELTHLGEVEVVLADPFPESYEAPTGDPELLRQTLELVAEEGISAGGLAFLRDEVERTRDPQEARRALAVEREVPVQSVQGVAETVAARTAPSPGQGARPSALILVQGGFSTDPAAFYQPFLGEDEETEKAAEAAVTQATESPARRLDRVAEALAAAGWVVSPLAPPGLGERRSDLDAPLERLAATTGGHLARSGDELGTVLGELSRRSAVRFVVPGPVDGTPRPLEIRASGAGTGQVPTAAAWAASATPDALAGARARRLLEEPTAHTGNGWTVEGRVLLPASENRAGVARLETLLAWPEQAGSAPGGPLRVSVVATRLGGEVVERHETVTPPDLATATGWLYRTDLAESEDVQSVAVVVEDLSTGQWGGSAARFAAQPIPVPSRRVAVQGQVPEATLTVDPTAPAGSASATARRDPGTPRPTGDRTAPDDGRRPLVLVPPAERPVRGRARFRVLASSYAVARVEFLLDGISVASDDRAPFVATLDLGPDERTATVQAVAYDSSGARLGEHSLVVNAADRAFDVRVTGFEQTTAGALPAVRLEAQVTVPPGQDLSRVEIFWNETLASVVRNPAAPASGAPVTIDETLTVPSSGRTGSDYLRVVATLADGSTLEDVQLLSADVADRVEVNLVEIFAVVRDRSGAVVTDLEARDFRVTLDGDEIDEIGGLQFRRADDVPLVLGLLVDTSESMWPLMIDTRQTASRFVLETVRDGDRAFLVEFDNQPRLAQETTDDVALLLRRFRELEAGGATALYDAVVFSLVEIEADRGGRRALVLITDGEDYGSRFGSRRAIRTARELGTPIYGISLAPLYRERGSARAAALEALTDSTGGRTFSITDTAELAAAFAEINLELRSQYILTFPTREALDERALRDLEVEVPGRAGMRVRTVIGER